MKNKTELFVVMAGLSCCLSYAGSAALTNSLAMVLVSIAPGSFVMGQDGPAADYQMTKHAAKCDDADWDERPAHRVTITREFFMGATEVTLGQYRKFKPDFRADGGADDEAVTGVTWSDAVKFCEWLSAQEGKTYRLPTEAEWEWACRAGTTTPYNTGERLPDGFQKWFGGLGRGDRYFTDGKLPRDYQHMKGKPAPRVAQTPANALGLFDMHGNVAEWCADWYGPYETGAQTDPLGRSSGDFRVIRGGHHTEFTRLLRSANRGAWLPQTGDPKTGFRVVLGELPKGNLLPPPPPPLNAQHVEQSVARIESAPADVPFFAEPKPFVKIPTNSAGPLFSWHNHSPAIAECPNGDLLAVWYSCVDEGGSELCNIASRLRRGSKEWEPASPFWDGADVNDHAPKLWWDGDRTLFHLARGHNENILRRSTDNGATWSPAQVLMPHGEFGNQLIRTREGVLVITHDSRQCSLVFSRDGGQTWAFNDVAQRASDFRPGGQGFRYPGIHAPIVQLADGRLMVVSRNDKPEDQAKFGGKSPFSFTSDLGQTWTYAASEFPSISSVQRQVLMRLKEGPLLLCSFTDQRRDWNQRKGMTFKAADGGEFTGYGLFAALSFDEGRTWLHRRLITTGGRERTLPGIDRGEFTMSDTLAESSGYLAAIQTRDGRIQLISSKEHYVFNLAWLKALPPPPAKSASATTEIRLIMSAPDAASGNAARTIKPAYKQETTIFKEAGRYGGWPANHGLWQWGDELVVGFEACWYKAATNDHAIDREKPFYHWQARSPDGGKTWAIEDKLPFSDPKTEAKPQALTEPLDFTAPDSALMFRFGSLHVGPSWFYVSGDRCRTWRGPFTFAVEGIDKVCTRTDLVVLGPRDCLLFGSAAKLSDGKEGRVFCARTTDGGQHWKLVSLVGPESPAGGFAIMPSTVRLSGGALITTIRHGKDGSNIRAWRSDDLGGHWTALGAATGNIGGNPPALVILKDGRLCLNYGYRRSPFGIRARISGDEGRTWGPEIILRDDGRTGDLGYPRSLVRPDGKILTVYYFNGPRDEDRTIQGTLWTP